MRKTLLAGSIIVMVVAACRNGMDGKVLLDGTGYQNETGSKQRIHLPDGSSVLLAPGTKLELVKGFGADNRQASLDGEAWFETAGGGFILQTRDLLVEVLRAGRFHADAIRSRPGEEIDVLEGGLRVKKSYHSDTDNEPELLGPGEMVMINRDIDLMEKERLNQAELDKLKGGW